MNIELFLLDVLVTASHHAVRSNATHKMHMKLAQFQSWYWSRVRNVWTGEPRMRRHQ